MLEKLEYVLFTHQWRYSLQWGLLGLGASGSTNNFNRKSEHI